MKYIYIIITFFFVSISGSVAAQVACDELPTSWNSMEEAYEKIRTAKFLFGEHLSFAKNKYYKKASYFICDGTRGYLVVAQKKGEYVIHQNVPIQVWEFLKEAKTPVGYYRFYIEKRFNLVLK